MILVVGGSGDLGGRIVRLLRERGEQVRCLVRAGTDERDLRDLGVELAGGDLTAGDTLEVATQGVDTVVATATAIARRLAGARSESVRAVDGTGMARLVDASGRAGVSRFVYVSGAGMDVGPGSPLERAKIATERRLQGSAMREVIVRPDAFQEVHLAPLGRFDLALGKVEVIGRGDNPRRWVSTADVASLVAAVAVEPEPPELVEFGGPEALSRNEAAAVAERVTGRTMRRRHLPRAAARLGMRLTARSNDALSSVFGAGLAQDTVPARWDEAPLTARGIEPISASEFIERQALALRPGV